MADTANCPHLTIAIVPRLSTHTSTVTTHAGIQPTRQCMVGGGTVCVACMDVLLVRACWCSPTPATRTGSQTASSHEIHTTSFNVSRTGCGEAVSGRGAEMCGGLERLGALAVTRCHARSPGRPASSRTTARTAAGRKSTKRQGAAKKVLHPESERKDRTRPSQRLYVQRCSQHWCCSCSGWCLFSAWSMCGGMCGMCM